MVVLLSVSLLSWSLIACNGPRVAVTGHSLCFCGTHWIPRTNFLLCTQLPTTTDWGETSTRSLCHCSSSLTLFLWPTGLVPEQTRQVAETGEGGSPGPPVQPLLGHGWCSDPLSDLRDARPAAESVPGLCQSPQTVRCGLSGCLPLPPLGTSPPPSAVARLLAALAQVSLAGTPVVLPC